MRDILITNMSDMETQRHLLPKTTELNQALHTAINMNTGLLNQMRITSKITLSINRVQKTRDYLPENRQEPTNTSFSRTNQPKQCRNCGPNFKQNAWQPNFKQNSTALWEIAITVVYWITLRKCVEKRSEEILNKISKVLKTKLTKYQ